MREEKDVAQLSMNKLPSATKPSSEIQQQNIASVVSLSRSRTLKTQINGPSIDYWLDSAPPPPPHPLRVGYKKPSRQTTISIPVSLAILLLLRLFISQHYGN